MIEVGAVPVARTESTSGQVARVAENVAYAFGRAQETIIEVERSTAEMIERTRAVKFGLRFSARPAG